MTNMYKELEDINIVEIEKINKEKINILKWVLNE